MSSAQSLCRIAATLVLLFGANLLLAAQIRISNPYLPPDEKIVYTQKTGDNFTTVTHALQLKTGDGLSWYEFTSHSPEVDLLLKLSASNLFAYYSDVTTRSADSVIRRTAEVQKNLMQPQADELPIADFNSLPVVLRGFPFSTVVFAKIVFAGAAAFGSGFSFELSVQGKETITINNAAWECWRIQMGLGGIPGAFMGKTTLWYSTKPASFLVRFDGPTGGPGSPNRVLELVSYQAGTDSKPMVR